MLTPTVLPQLPRTAVVAAYQLIRTKRPEAQERLESSCPRFGR